MDRLETILGYWFGSPGPLTVERFQQRGKMWFMRNADVDRYVREQFSDDVVRAASGALAEWEKSPRGRLGLIVLLDQFPRNMHRGSPRAFEDDAKAMKLSLEGVQQKMDAALDLFERWVFYLPLMHAEDAKMQALCVECFEGLRTDAPGPLKDAFVDTCNMARRHRDIVDRFGRFPHRNETLGRPSTEAETAFLREPNSSF